MKCKASLEDRSTPPSFTALGLAHLSIKLKISNYLWSSEGYFSSK